MTGAGITEWYAVLAGSYQALGVTGAGITEWYAVHGWFLSGSGCDRSGYY